MKLYFSNVLFVSLAFSFVSTFGQSPASLTEGLIFYADFNQSVTPRTALGGSEISGTVNWVKGPFGQACELSTPLIVPLIKNLDPKQGTVVFWMQLPLALGQTDYDLALFDGTEHIRLRWLGKQKSLSFMTGNTVPDLGFRWHYGSVNDGRNWAPGEWHQVALLWNASLGTKSLWLDGKNVLETKTEFINPAHTGNKTMNLGQKNLAMAVDELAVWNRNLLKDEIIYLLKNGLASTPIAASTIPTKKEKPPLRIDPFSWRANPSGTILKKGESILFPILLSNRTLQIFDASVLFQLRDLWGFEQIKISLPVQLESGAVKMIQLPWTAGEDGVYKWVAKITSPSSNWEIDCGSFSVLDQTASHTNQSSFFGHHVNSWDKGLWLDQAVRLGSSWMRGHNMLQSTW